jgi:hypothetical protein
MYTLNYTPTLGVQIDDKLYLGVRERERFNTTDVEDWIKMDKAMIFAAHLVTSCGVPFQNH